MSIGSSLIKIGSAIAAVGLLAGGIAVLGTWYKHARETDQVPDEQKIARTLEIIRTSTPTDHKALKVLFYGQSITASGWESGVLDNWHQKYPNTVFVVQNRALGGFSSDALIRTTEQDIAAFYPDLIVFHVYGDDTDYEKILRLFRSRTAADIIVQTDHGNVLPDPYCQDGLRLSLHEQPGCTGKLFVRQRQWEDEMSYHLIPRLARKYGLAVEPQRTWWRDYLLRTHIRPQSLLVDEVHPNQQGKLLMAQFFNQYFDALVTRWNGQTGHNVVSIPAKSPSVADGKETFSFDGSRLELISTQKLPTWPTVTIDGKSPRDLDGCYQVSRTTPLSTVPEWPALRRVTLHHDHTVEDWTATFTKIRSDQNYFTFTVRGSVSGDEGSGDSDHDFISKTGNLGIEGYDWMVGREFAFKQVPLHAPIDVHWSVYYACGGEPEAIDMHNATTQYRYVLGAGLPNQQHTVVMSPLTKDVSDISEFRAYKPPLQ